MLQPRELFDRALLIAVVLVLVDCITGTENFYSPRRRRQDGDDVTTVLLVDNHDRSSLGRFLNVKPDLGLIISTARTFIQEGVTTEYATQVLGTTLDNGRLYAHLLTKSSRVLYDKDLPSKAHNDFNSKKWNIDKNLINTQNFVKNTDFISPNHVDTFLVFPTTKPEVYQEQIEQNTIPLAFKAQESSEEELLKSSPSNNPRVPITSNQEKDKLKRSQNNVKVFQINPQVRDMKENLFTPKEFGSENEIAKENFLSPSKVKALDNLPTFTVRNEFSPSGYSFLGDLPVFDVNTERSKPTTAAERKAKFLLRAGLVKPEPKDLKTVTYSGFADFTTTVGDTVIIFSPHTSEVPKPDKGQVTKISVEPTIQPTASIKTPEVSTSIKTFVSQSDMETKTVEGHKLNVQSKLPTMVIDAKDRHRNSKEQETEQHEDMEAKSAVLAHEQQLSSSESTMLLTPEAIQPSESQPQMLSTPSNEDIAKIIASLQAQAKQATEPLSSAATIFFDDEPATEPTTQEPNGGATTIFFDDDLPVQATGVLDDEPHTKQITTNPPTTTEIDTTTENKITTEKLREETTTQKEEITTNKEEEDTTVPQQIEEEILCTGVSKVVPLTEYKTLTYLTTFFIPQDDSTTTSIKSNEVTTREVSYQTVACYNDDSMSEEARPATEKEEITTIKQQEELLITTEADDLANELIPTTDHLSTLEVTTDNEQQDTTTTEITTERRHVTESEPETTETTTDEGDELELIFKTLYTTYTYLTTYFQDQTSSVESRIVVTTNVITSTIDPSEQPSDPAVAGLFARDEEVVSYKSRPISFEDFAEISPSSVGVGRPTESPSLDQEEFDGVLESYPAQATPALGDDAVSHTQAAVKTYYTTYTYFTTIFVDGETEISSRTEVFTNYVTPSADLPLESLAPTKIPSTIFNKYDDGDKEFLKNLNIKSMNSYNSTIQRNKPTTVREEQTKDVDYKFDNNILTTSVSNNYVTLQRATTESDDIYLDLSDYETISTMVTDVRSSTSEGDRRIIDNVDKRNVLDDQIVSESNNESEIIPSPTLLLQTSYTTFTYFTTMYHGTTSSNVVSRLETITNIVTETITPTHILSPEDLSLPITYFTTFTYWTTLYKDGSTKIQSREETISNVVTPSAVAPTDSIVPTVSPIISTPVQEVTPSTLPEELLPSSIVDKDNLTTYFTTYTYYTTSYIGDSTILKSRLETVSNVLNNTVEVDSNQIGRAISLAAKQNQIDSTSIDSTKPSKQASTGLISTIVSSQINSDITTFYTTEVIGTYIDGVYAQVLESVSTVVTPTIKPSVVEKTTKPTGVVSLNQGKIVDADGISTLYYTTQAVGAYIDGSYAQIIASTSSLKVDEVKQSEHATDPPVLHRTGLVRLIEGSIVQDNTTTLYQSKVLGTVIDGRYAQIIESTSSFIVGRLASAINPSTSSNEILPTPTKAPDEIIQATTTPISPSPVVIEGSISDRAKTEEETATEEIEDSEDDDDGDNSRTKSRLTFQTRKRTFSPVIRPFASRPRPTFAPSRKKAGPGSATTITRSDFTPTITVVPASKQSRFGNRNKSSANNNSISPTASSGRRFSRPKSSSAVNGGSSSSFGRGRSSSKISPSSSRGRGGFRSSGIAASPANQRSSSSRFRIRPTPAASLNRSPNSNAVTPPSDEENDLTTQITENPTDVVDDNETTLPISTTTESVSRRNNPLLSRFRRPPLGRQSTTPRPTTKGGNGSKATTRNGNRATTTTTTGKPKTSYNRAGLNRQRPANALFPRKNLFTTTTTPAPEEEDLEEEGAEEENEDDTDYESSDRESQTELAPDTTPLTRKSRGFTPGVSSVKIRPFAGLKRRTKRESTYSRFRRPNYRSSSTTSTPVQEEVPDTEAPKTNFRSGKNNRFSRNRSSTTPNPKRITPSKSSIQGRSQFTLREKDSSTPRSNFRRPSSSPSRHRTTTSSGVTRPKAPRLRNNQQTESTTTRKSSNGRQSSRSSRQRQSSRQRPSSREQVDSNFVLPDFDGTIIVTHQIPTEITIPVVNGKITEYKNVITAKPSTEVLGPQQYTTSINAFGKGVTVLLSEATTIDGSGATQITQFVLNETPTTSIIFTPTYIRGRKTSFSHVVPSTAYGVEPVVNTIQPALAAQAPLANILLSQLLLGGLQQPNPVLALQNQGVPQTPTTEYKVRTTTYVTTVTKESSTVIPLTFRGKEILTTIIDSSVEVVTATEFLTDTIVVTPTVPFPVANNQLNSLLVPLLLQQQQQPMNPIITQPADVFQLNTNVPHALPLIQEPERINLAISEDYLFDEVEDKSEPVVSEEVTKAPRRKHSRKKPKKPAPTEPPKETSVITLYVSGRTPGEFSTVLSTVVVGEESKRKREAIYIPLEPSKRTEDVKTISYIDSYISPGTRGVTTESFAETESLESIIGDVSKYVTKVPKTKPSKKYKHKYVKATSSGNAEDTSGNFLAL